MKVLLTGASGLIGQAIHKLLCQHHDVLTAGRRANNDVALDLTSDRAFQECELPGLDALVHCAGVVDEDFHADSAAAFAMAYSGADTLVKSAVQAGARTLIYISSAHVYGPMVGTLDETRPVDPRSDYALAHFMTEQVFRRNLPEGGTGFALRPCAVFGELSDPENFRRWSLIPFAFPLDAIEKGGINILSTGEQRRNFVGTGDIARLVASLLQSQTGAGWQTINPIGNYSASVLEFARLCASVAEEITGRECSVTRRESPDDTPGSDFEFQCSAGQGIGTQSIRAFIYNLMTQLRRKGIDG